MYACVYEIDVGVVGMSVYLCVYVCTCVYEINVDMAVMDVNCEQEIDAGVIVYLCV